MKKSYKIKLILSISIPILVTIFLIVKGLQWYWCMIPSLCVLLVAIIAIILLIKDTCFEKPGEPFVETIMDVPVKKSERFYMQFIHKWDKDKKHKTICYKNLTSGDYFKFTLDLNLSDNEISNVIPLKYNKIISEKEFNKKYKGVKLMNIDVVDKDGTHKIGTLTTKGITLLEMHYKIPYGQNL
jgi:hypothetical protein